MNLYGYVGIGTTPTAKLHLYDTNNATKLIIQDNTTTTGIPNEIVSNSVGASTIIPGTSDKYMIFTYSAAYDTGTGQAQYPITIPAGLLCDILIVGGGGSGGTYITGEVEVVFYI